MITLTLFLAIVIIVAVVALFMLGLVGFAVLDIGLFIAGIMLLGSLIF